MQCPYVSTVCIGHMEDIRFTIASFWAIKCVYYPCNTATVKGPWNTHTHQNRRCASAPCHNAFRIGPATGSTLNMSEWVCVSVCMLLCANCAFMSTMPATMTMTTQLDALRGLHSTSARDSDSASISGTTTKRCLFSNETLWWLQQAAWLNLSANVKWEWMDGSSAGVLLLTPALLYGTLRDTTRN